VTSPTGRTVVVYGAGIAGLTAAHEFIRRGWAVSVYEAHSEAGGFFRSARGSGDHAMPSEYSWHGMGPWYHNVFDVMRQIPFDAEGSVYDRALSRPIDFGVAPDDGTAEFDDPSDFLIDVSRMFRMTRVDWFWWTRLMLKEWTANRRSTERYATRNAAAQWGKRLSAEASSTWSACFGPWIGSDWTQVSLHQAGQFFLKQLTSQPSHPHAADSEGAAWVHGARSGWLLLRGPSSEFWFDKWIQHLTTAGVTFHWEQTLHHFDYDGSVITAAHLESAERVEADVHVFATNPFAAVEILERSPDLARLDQLCLFEPLTADGPHVQVSFRIAFSERIEWPRPRCALVVADSEFDLTIFARNRSGRPASISATASLRCGPARHASPASPDACTGCPSRSARESNSSTKSTLSSCDVARSTPSSAKPTKVATWRHSRSCGSKSGTNGPSPPTASADPTRSGQLHTHPAVPADPSNPGTESRSRRSAHAYRCRRLEH